MKPEEALQYLDQVCASIDAKRGTHVTIQQAVASIAAALNELAELKKPQKCKSVG